MTIRIIDFKKIDLTEDEHKMYENIVKSYTKQPYQKGEDFFIDLFETNEDGIITFLKPPSQRQVSLEIYLFMSSVMIHQHLRLSQDQVNKICKKMQDKINEIDEKLSRL